MRVTHFTQIMLCIIFANNTQAQDDSLFLAKPVVNVSGFIDVFYVYDFNQPNTSYRQTFLYNHNRHNEVNLNLGLIKLSLRHPKYRANIALQAGTYPHDNYAQEPEAYRNIFEANAGVSLNKKNTTWLDAGIFTSHIGFESAISSENWTLTRSLVAENSPYYLTGLKLTHAPNDFLSLSLLVCNGWQRIQRLPGNSLPSFGTQVYYEKGDVVFNWNTFLGTDDPDSVRRIRFFNNLYSQWNITEKAGVVLGFDVGIQQKEKSSSTYNVWYSPVFIFRHVLTRNWSYAVRGEYYSDPAQVIMITENNSESKTFGFSLNFDYNPFEKVLCRVEARWLRSDDRLFKDRNSFSNSNLIIASSMAITIH
jgi:hypothetical protein